MIVVNSVLVISVMCPTLAYSEYCQLNAIPHCEYQHFNSGAKHYWVTFISVHGGHYLLILSIIDSTYVTH